MSHITIIISRAPSPTTNAVADAAECSYEYQMPVPHGATPQQVAEMVRKAYRRLEGVDHDEP